MKTSMTMINTKINLLQKTFLFMSFKIWLLSRRPSFALSNLSEVLSNDSRWLSRSESISVPVSSLSIAIFGEKYFLSSLTHSVSQSYASPGCFLRYLLTFSRELVFLQILFFCCVHPSRSQIDQTLQFFFTGRFNFQF